MEQITNIIEHDGVFMLRLLAALVLGGLVGLERQSRGRSAGLRTNILVCLGSAAVIVAFQKLSAGVHQDATSVIRMDPARAAAGVITGIGFLGAGTIVKSKDFVRGLTTAASIWVVSAIGVTVGLGEYVIAVVLTVLVLITLFVLHLVPIGFDRYGTLQLVWRGEPALLDEVVAALEAERITVKHRNVMRKPGEGTSRVTLAIRYRGDGPDGAVFTALQQDERFDEVSWL
jgi:putative Mg2+ transporter-C (MgtC) family protein